MTKAMRKRAMYGMIGSMSMGLDMGREKGERNDGVL